MKLSANEAAKRTGKSVPTITRAIKSGKISAEKTGKGGYLIEPSELFRAFPAITEPNYETPPMLDSETHKRYPHETLSLQEKVSSLEVALADAKAERDEWRDQAKRLAMALPAPEAAEPEKAGQKHGFWKRLFG
jgi:excisionase family DNA binding protein